MKFKMVVILVLVLFAGCDLDSVNKRTVHVVIPQHPWEENGRVKLWYSLKWNENGRIQTMYIDKDTREVVLEVSKKHTVYICAYPLGEMLPFGTALTPTSGKKEVYLNQNEGYLVHLLINTEPEVVQYVNYDLLLEKVSERTDDTRRLKDSELLADVLNGKLTDQSVELRSNFMIEEIPIPNGFWVSEYERDGAMEVTNNKTEVLELPVGVYRYYCVESDREFRVVIDEDGTVFHSLRYGMTGL